MYKGSDECGEGQYYQGDVPFSNAGVGADGVEIEQEGLVAATEFHIKDVQRKPEVQEYANEHRYPFNGVEAFVGRFDSGSHSFKGAFAAVVDEDDDEENGIEHSVDE